MTKRVPNPYLDEFRAACKQPDAHDDWDLHWSLAHRFSWAVPTHNTLCLIKEFAGSCGIVEIGAGTGYWASLLEQMGVEVIAYDKAPVERKDNRYHSSKRATVAPTSFTKVLEGGARAASRHPDRTLMMCWPPHDQRADRPFGERSMSDRALSSYKGNRLVYIGQPDGGVTGSGKFHQNLRKFWVCIAKKRTPNFRGKCTSVYLYQRRAKPA